jgi:hypothetical protein
MVSDGSDRRSIASFDFTPPSIRKQAGHCLIWLSQFLILHRRSPIDRIPERLQMAREHVGSETVNYRKLT